jgi:hypothetical protein
MEILIPIAIVLAFVLFFMYASKSGAKLLKVRQEKLNRAEKGKAKIIGFSSAGVRGTGSGGYYQGYKFTLEVSSEYKSPYKTEVIWEVYPMGVPQVQEGLEVNVKIDSEDPMIIYPSVNGVEFSWNGMMIHGKRNK